MKPPFSRLFVSTFILVLLTLSLLGSDKGSLLHDHIDWPAFLSRHDLIWNKIPASWGDAAFLGNGRLAVSVQRAGRHGSLRFSVDRTDVYDHRDGSWGWTAYSRPRYHVGDFLLETVGELTSCHMRLDLWNAELRGVFTTDKGQIKFVVLVHATTPLVMVELQPDRGEQQCRWRFEPSEACTTRDNGGVKDEAAAKKYEQTYGHKVRVWEPNPRPELKTEGDTHLCIQNLLAGGGYTTAWHEHADDDGKRTLSISVAMSFPALTSPHEANEAIVRAASTDRNALLNTHRDWWHAYYPESFISLNETKVESFYWIQMYKYACAARADTGVIDTHGPWFRPTIWPYTTMDMNTQITYWALNDANRLGIADSLYRNLDEKFDNLVSNVVPVEQQADSAALGLATTPELISPLDDDMRYRRLIADLPWLCQNYWEFYRHTMDDERLRQHLYPLLRRAINLYRHYLDDEKGVLHLEPTYCPEYTYVNKGISRDATIDLALLRWGCQTLLQTCDRLKIDDPLVPVWRDILKRLIDFSVDDYGFMVGRDIPFRHAHRHLSHLMAIYPLRTVNWEQPENRKLITLSLSKSVRDHLGDDYENFTAAWASCMYTDTGDSENAYKQFYLALDSMFRNTMFGFSGQNIETPLVTVQPIQEMLLQSWSGVIRVFPATPKEWPDVVFDNLRTEGAFLVSACREAGQTKWVRLKSLAGEPCRLWVDTVQPLKIVEGPKVDCLTIERSQYKISLLKDQEILLAPDDATDAGNIKPVPPQPGHLNLYGLP